jgi:thioredoxin-like negative regulator of GroEL
VGAPEGSLVIVDCYTPASESAVLVSTLERLAAEHRGRLQFMRIDVAADPAWWTSSAAAVPRVALFAHGELIDALGSSGDAAPPAEIVARFVERRLASDDDCEGGSCLI